MKTTCTENGQNKILKKCLIIITMESETLDNKSGDRQENFSSLFGPSLETMKKNHSTKTRMLKL